MSDRESSPNLAPPILPPQQKPETMDTDASVKEESPSPPSPTASAAPNSEVPLSSPSRQPRTTAAQRRAILRDDPLNGEVESHRIYCRHCQKWIKLAMNSEYSLANWKCHRQRCYDPPKSPQLLRRTPSKPSFSANSRVATAERKIVLLNDPQVKGFTTQRVQCLACKTTVELEGEVDYDLTKWAEHKEKCIPITPAPITPQGSRPRTFAPLSASSTHSQVSAGGSERSSTPAIEDTSNHLTESITQSSPAAVKIGVKRGRDEETEDEEQAARDERPTVRSRTETYKSPEKDPPSLFGMIVQPFREFARGFREGLGTT